MKAIKSLLVSAILLAGFTLSSQGQEAPAQKQDAPVQKDGQQIQKDAPPATPQKGEEPKADNPNAAEITFESEVHDYGTIKQGADGGCEFKFKNTGKDPLIISNAKGSCGCTVPTWPKEPIMKGQTGSIKVHYDTKRVGAFTKTVTINSNAKSDTKTLTIKGVVEASEENVDQSVPVKKSSGLPLENSK